MSTCPKSGKIIHRSKGAALKAIESINQTEKGSLDYTPYACGKHWHIGHDVRHLKKRIRSALSGAPKSRRRSS